MTDTPKHKAIKLNVTLLKKGLSLDEPEKFIEEYSTRSVISPSPSDTRASLEIKKTHLLYVKKNHEKHPKWVTTFKNKILGINLERHIPKNESYGVSLFVKVKNRIFCINWGMVARYNIIPSSIDKKFGIYTVSKIVADDEETKIKSAQSRVNETNPINKQRQYGSAVSGDELYFSMEDNEAIRQLVAVSGESLDFRKLVGKLNTLSIQFLFKESELPCLEHLPKKLSKLLDIYASVTEEDKRKMYKGLYPIDEGNTKELFDELEKKLAINSSDFFFFEPEIDFDFSSVDSFKLTVSGEEHENSEFLLQNYLAIKRAPKKSDLDSDTIQFLDEDDIPIKSWPLLDCLYGELEHNSTNYILSHGEWYEVSKDKYERINKKIASILDPSFIIPDNVSTEAKVKIQAEKEANPGKKIFKERIVNRLLCTHLDGLFFDEPNKQIKLYDDKFEVCDILLPQQKKFIHTKFNYGVEALGHLFNQGFVSGSSYARYKIDYAKAVNIHISDTSRHIPPDNKGYKIHYLIINSKTEDRLTFFSKMVLEDKVTFLESQGFKVSLSWSKDVC